LVGAPAPGFEVGRDAGFLLEVPWVVFLGIGFFIGMAGFCAALPCTGA
jgi:hypothetical protein